MTKDSSKLDAKEQSETVGITNHASPSPARVPAKKPSLITRVAAQLLGLVRPSGAIVIDPPTVGTPSLRQSSSSFLTMTTSTGWHGGVIPTPSPNTVSTKTLEEQLACVAGLFGSDVESFKDSPAAAMLRARAAHMPTEHVSSPDEPGISV